MQNFFSALDRSMHQQFSSLDERSNPVSRSLKHLEAEALIYIIGQYSIFPREIVNLLEEARTSLREWPTVHSALIENISEEKGSRTAGISHYYLLQSGILEEYSVDIATISAATGTSTFIETSLQHLRNTNKAFAAGAIYAIEASSQAEVRIVKTIAEKLSNVLHQSPLSRQSPLYTFLMSHIEDFEVGHEEALRTTITPQLETSSRGHFQSGFNSILTAMDEWWKSLHEEARCTRKLVSA
ncbi:MAG TPA: DUF3865 domain-containing protein [Allosphingosinicella sp.]|nr:DUF3865 domain-containing protein [Allosphingosinicella sp.]